MALSFVCLLTAAISIGALVVALRSSGLFLSKRCGELSLALSQLAESHESLTLQLRNIRSRLNMQAMRDRKAVAEVSVDDSPAIRADSTVEEANVRWARETNLALAQGRIKVR